MKSSTSSERIRTAIAFVFVSAWCAFVSGVIFGAAYAALRGLLTPGA